MFFLDVQIATPSRARIALPDEIAESQELAVNMMEGKRLAYIEHFTLVLRAVEGGQGG